MAISGGLNSKAGQPSDGAAGRSWKRIAFEQGQRRMSNETLSEFKARVWRTYNERQRAEPHYWRKDNPDGFSAK